MKINKNVHTVVIKFSYGGVDQFAKFRFKDCKIVSKDFRPSWVYGDTIVPCLDGIEDINEILKFIKSFAYCGYASIDSVNHEPLFYKQKTQKDIDIFATNLNVFLSEQSTKIFTSHILPILLKNKWVVCRSQYGYYTIGYKQKNGEFDNINNRCKDNLQIEYICNKFINSIIASDEKNCFSFNDFCKYIGVEKLIDLSIFQKLNYDKIN